MSRRCRPCCQRFQHGPERVAHELTHAYKLRLRSHADAQKRGSLGGLGEVRSHEPYYSESRFKLWARKFDELRSFALDKGHASPPLSNPLGRWAEFQRLGFLRGRLPKEREDMLRSIGFCFNGKQAQRRREELARRARLRDVEEGRCRRLTRGRREMLLRQDQESMASIKETQSRWGRFFKQLKDFKDKHNHPHVVCAFHP